MTDEDNALADIISARATTICLEPSSTLVLGNLGPALDQMRPALQHLADNNATGGVLAFEQPITVDTLPLDRIYLMGDEDCGVGVGCMDCDRGGLPIAYYTRYSAAYEDDDTVAKADTIAGLLATAIEHRRTVHPEAA